MRTAALLFLPCVVFLRVASAASAFRPPSVPLAVSSPYFSIWSDDAFNLQSQTVFWNGNPLTLDSLLQVDGTTYVLMGASVGKAATQLGLPNVTALSSTYAFTAGGVRATLRFTTPALPDDFEAASRGGTYVAWTLASVDGAAHNASILFDASGEAVTGGYAGEELEWDRPDIGGGGALALRIGLTGQREAGFNISAAMRRSTEPHQLQDFGFVYVLVDAAAAATTTSLIAPAGTVHAAFAATGALPGAAADATPPAPAAAAGTSAVVLGVALAVGAVPASGAPVTARVLLLCDPVVAVLSFEDLLPPLWRKDFPAGDTSVVPAAALVKALTDGDALIAASDALDAVVIPALTSAAGVDFANVAALTFRQVMGADGVTFNGSSVWMYQKEISSDGDMSTLDVIFPSAAQHIYFDGAATLAALLEPLLFFMADFYPNHKFTQPCSLHSAGKWPVVDAGDGGCSMPMESTGDVLLLAAAVTMARNGSADFAAPYMPLLRRFAGFCDSSLPFPAPQDMTDDFSHAPGNLTNLALKCIIGLGAQAYQEQVAGNVSGATALYARASARGAEFAAHAPSVDGSHYKFIYNETWDDSYGLMYNAFWARLLGLEWTIPNFRAGLTSHYAFLSTVTANATWCIPLSSMEHDSKWDWLVYTAANAFTNGTGGAPPAPTAFSRNILAQLVFFANTTSSRFPLTDHPECTGNFPPTAAADRARPVLGAFFAPLLISSPPPAFVAQRAAIAAFAVASAPVAASASATLSWFSASDTHLGHDPVPANGGPVVTSVTKNTWAINEMNNLPTPSWPNATWPVSLGGGPVVTPVGVTVSGDLIDSGDSSGTVVNGCHQWSNFTTLYGLDGTDGLLKYRVNEGRGNHDGLNTSDALPNDCSTVPSRAIAARNKLRAADPAFNITNVSAPTGLHYSWDWSLGASCKIHFVHLNLFPGHTCGSPSNPGKEGSPGFDCVSGWTYPEDSLGFLKEDLAKYAAEPGTMVVTLQHYGYDGWSNTWCAYIFFPTREPSKRQN